MYGKRRSRGNKLLGSVEESFPCGFNISYEVLRGWVLFFWSCRADRKGREVGYGRTGDVRLHFRAYCRRSLHDCLVMIVVAWHHLHLLGGGGICDVSCRWKRWIGTGVV